VLYKKYFIIPLILFLCLTGCSQENQTETLLPMPEFLKGSTLTLQTDQYTAVGRDSETHCGFFSRTRILNDITHRIITRRHIDNDGGENGMKKKGLSVERLVQGKRFVPTQFLSYKHFSGFWVMTTQYFVILRDEKGLLYKVVTVSLGDSNDDTQPYFLCEKDHLKAKMLTSRDFWPIYALHDKEIRDGK
jgi:hypothetical protein